ncbi:MAG: ParB/RepB/Spo0J family partition protein [Patescibacteria group bacterium]
MDEKINSLGRDAKKESIFWIELDKIKPNPLQPRREFDPAPLQELADSIREYGLLQPVVVIRKEQDTTTGRLVEYELLAGERRLRAAKLAGLQQIPVIIRDDTTDKIKLELALVENLQREDLNPIERARAFKKLVEEFGMLQREVGEKIGKSREVVANTMRLLALPDDIQQAVATSKITEGHTRPLLMLVDQPDQQRKLFDDIIAKQLSVRQAENISRTIAKERARSFMDPTTRMVQDQLENLLGTRVSIEKKGEKGKISIEFFSEEELQNILHRIANISGEEAVVPVVPPAIESITPENIVSDNNTVTDGAHTSTTDGSAPVSEQSPHIIQENFVQQIDPTQPA